MPHSQGLSNNPYPEPNQPNSSYWYLFKILAFPKGLIPVGVPVKILKAIIPSSVQATRPSHLNLLDLISWTILGEKYKLWSSSLWFIKLRARKLENPWECDIEPAGVRQCTLCRSSQICNQPVLAVSWFHVCKLHDYKANRSGFRDDICSTPCWDAICGLGTGRLPQPYPSFRACLHCHDPHSTASKSKFIVTITFQQFTPLCRLSRGVWSSSIDFKVMFSTPMGRLDFKI